MSQIGERILDVIAVLCWAVIIVYTLGMLVLITGTVIVDYHFRHLGAP